MAAARSWSKTPVGFLLWMAGLGEAVDPATAQADPEMPPVLARRQYNLKEGAASMRAARQAGVKIALGSDMSLATGPEISGWSIMPVAARAPADAHRHGRQRDPHRF